MLYQTKKRQRPWFKETLPKQGQRALEKECGQQAARTGEETTDDHYHDQHASSFVCFFHFVVVHWWNPFYTSSCSRSGLDQPMKRTNPSFS